MSNKRADVVSADGRRIKGVLIAMSEGNFVATAFGTFEWCGDAWRWVRDRAVTLELEPPAQSAKEPTK